MPNEVHYQVPTPPGDEPELEVDKRFSIVENGEKAACSFTVPVVDFKVPFRRMKFGSENYKAVVTAEAKRWADDVKQRVDGHPCWLQAFEICKKASILHISMQEQLAIKKGDQVALQFLESVAHEIEMLWLDTRFNHVFERNEMKYKMKRYVGLEDEVTEEEVDAWDLMRTGIAS